MQELWSTLKTSKSKPDTCIFIHDSPEEIKRKMKKAFCPEGEVEFNPVLDWCKSLVFPIQKTLHIERLGKFEGNLDYTNYKDLEKDFIEKRLHPQDLKKGVADAIIRILEPARKHFEKPEIKKMLEEMEELIITR